MPDLMQGLRTAVRRDPGFGPVETSDRCQDTRPCPHCAAGRPAAPAGMNPRELHDSVWELDDDVRQSLPPAFHRPVFIDTCTPKGWFCNCCWDEGTVQQWPCSVAQAHGTYVQRTVRFERETVGRLADLVVHESVQVGDVIGPNAPGIPDAVLEHIDCEGDTWRRPADDTEAVHEGQRYDWVTEGGWSTTEGRMHYTPLRVTKVAGPAPTVQAHG